MTTLLAMTTCPNCGAPHSVAPGRSHIICVYCSTSLTVSHGAGAAAQLKPDAISTEEIERIKQLLIDGKRDEAVAHYMLVASVTKAEAERAVDDIVVTAYHTLVRHLPIRGVGFLIYGAVIAVSVGVAAATAYAAVSSPAWLIGTALAMVFLFFRLLELVRHLTATLVSSFGATGRGRVLRYVTMREMEADGFLGMVLLEVTPDDGRPPFVDQETVFVSGATRAKLAVGNVVGVRFDRACEHVYIRMPVTVL